MAFTDDTDDTDDDKPLTAEDRYNQSLAKEIAEVNAYKKALEEEFANTDVDDPEVQKQVRKQIHELVPDACERIMWLLKHSSSESVQANLAKYILSESMKSADADKPKDALTEMFDKLRVDDVEAEVAADESSQ